MWLRLGIQTDFSLTNTTGIRADLVPGPVTIEQMFNIFPFDNSITKMQLSGVEVQELFDFVARRSVRAAAASRRCRSPARASSSTARRQTRPRTCRPALATNIYIGTVARPVKCAPHAGQRLAASRSPTAASAGRQCRRTCDSGGVCYQPIQPIASYELATSDYLAGGRQRLPRPPAQHHAVRHRVQQRDALIDYIRAGKPCGADAAGNLTTCSTDNDCAGVGDGFVCACPEAVVEAGGALPDGSRRSCDGKGTCVLAQCRDDVAAFQRTDLHDAPNDAMQKAVRDGPRPVLGRRRAVQVPRVPRPPLGNFTDGRMKMVGQ